MGSIFFFFGWGVTCCLRFQAVSGCGGGAGAIVVALWDCAIADGRVGVANLALDDKETIDEVDRDV